MDALEHTDLLQQPKEPRNIVQEALDRLDELSGKKVQQDRQQEQQQLEEKALAGDTTAAAVADKNAYNIGDDSLGSSSFNIPEGNAEGTDNPIFPEDLPESLRERIAPLVTEAFKEGGQQAADEEAYRWANAWELSKFYNISLSEAVQKQDDLNSQILGPEEKTWKDKWTAVQQSWQLGQNVLKEAELGKELEQYELEGNAEGAAAAQKAIDALDAWNASLSDSVPRSWGIKMLEAAAQTLPYSAAVGVPETLTAVVLPELAPLVGGVIGADLMRGSSYVDFRRAGATPQQARGLALADGVAQSVVEQALGTIAGTAAGAAAAAGTRVINQTLLQRGINAITAKLKLGGTGFKALARGVMNYGADAAEEGLEEAVQQFEHTFIQQVGSWVTENQIVAPSWKEDAESAWDQAQSAFLGSLLLGIPAGGFNALATVRDFADVHDAAIMSDSREDFVARAKEAAGASEEGMSMPGSKVFEGMDAEQAAQTAGQIYDNFTEERNADRDEVTAQKAEEIKESLTAAEGIEETETDEGGEETGDIKAEYRDSEGNLYSTQDVDEHGNFTYKVGDPTVQDNNNYGYIKGKVDEEKQTVEIEEFKLASQRQNLRQDIFQDFARQYPGYDIKWDVKGERASIYKKQLEEMNPQGKNSLNWYTSEGDLKATDARVKVAKELSEKIFFQNTDELRTGVALFEAMAEKQGMSIDEFYEKNFGSQILHDDSENLEAGGHAGGMKVQQLKEGVRAIIYTSKESSDFTTWVHELTHIYRKLFLTGKDLEKVETALGVKEGKWTREQEEEFAKGFEYALRQGQVKNSFWKKIYEEIAYLVDRIFHYEREWKNLNPALIKAYNNMFHQDENYLGKADLAVRQILNAKMAEAEHGTTESAEEFSKNNVTAMTGEELERMGLVKENTAIRDAIAATGYDLSDQKNAKIFEALKEKLLDMPYTVEGAGEEQIAKAYVDVVTDPLNSMDIGQLLTDDAFFRNESADIVAAAIMLELSDMQDNSAAVEEAVQSVQEAKNAAGDDNEQNAAIIDAADKTSAAVDDHNGGNAPPAYDIFQDASINLQDKKEMIMQASDGKLLPRGGHIASLYDEACKYVKAHGNKLRETQARTLKSITGWSYENGNYFYDTATDRNIEEGHARTLEAVFENRKNFLREPYLAGHMEEVLPGLEAYSYLPELGRILVKIAADGEKGEGYSFVQNEIIINASEVKDLEGVKAKLLEGIQNAVLLGSTENEAVIQERNAGSSIITFMPTEAEETLYQTMPEVLYQDEYELSEREKAVKKLYENTDRYMKAPNGKNTNLTERQWLQVRTAEFKAWFGDWENDREHSSAVIDENGEPRVVWHGSRSAGFTEFNDVAGNKQSSAPDGSNFFSSSWEVAMTYSGTRQRVDFTEEGERRGNYGVFLNIRNPQFDDFEGATWEGFATGKYQIWGADEEGEHNDLITNPKNGRQTWDSFEEAEKYAKEAGVKDYWIQEDPWIGRSTNEVAADAMNWSDGAIIENVVDEGSNNTYGYPETDFIVFEPNQIKSAFDNNGDFDKNNDDILYQPQKLTPYAIETQELELSEMELRGGYDAKEAKRIRANFDRIDHETAWYKTAVWCLTIRNEMEKILSGTDTVIKDGVENDLLKDGILENYFKDAYDILKEEYYYRHGMTDKLPKDRKQKLFGLRYFFAGGGHHLIGSSGKAVHYVSASFLNCDPSPDCARYCYAATGNDSFMRNIILKELINYEVENDTEWAAGAVSKVYTTLGDWHCGVALRLLDVGDLSEKWLKFVNLLNNKYYISCQIFSKRPELLEQIDPFKNVVMLSIDKSNTELAAKYPKLPIAYVYSGTKEDVAYINSQKARYTRYSGSILPKHGTKPMKKELVDKLEKWMKSYTCPVAAGWKDVKTPEEIAEMSIANDYSGWNCTSCDKAGQGVGCSFKRGAKVRKRFIDNLNKIPDREFYRLDELYRKSAIDAVKEEGVSDEEIRRIFAGMAAIDVERIAGHDLEGNPDGSGVIPDIMEGIEGTGRRNNPGDQPDKDDEILHQEIGENGAAGIDRANGNHNLFNNWKIAFEMESQKKSNEAIKLATGWEKGKDGQWRYEISDKDAKFDVLNGTMEFMKEHPRLAELDELAEKLSPDEDLPEELNEEYQKETLTYLDWLRQRNITHDNQKGWTYKLGEVMDHPELYKAYPEARNIPVIFDPESDPTCGGFYRESDKSIVLKNPDLTTDEGIRWTEDTILHEVQHYIQHREGFAKGGSADEEYRDTYAHNYNLIRQQYANDKEEYESWLEKRDEMQYVLNSRRFSDKPEQFKKTAWFMAYGAWKLPRKKGEERSRILADLIDQWREEESKRYGERYGMTVNEFYLRKTDEELKSDIRKADYRAKKYEDNAFKYYRADEIYKAINDADIEEVYYRLAGEVEARNTVYRRNMSQEELRNSPAARTMDRDWDKQVVYRSQKFDIFASPKDPRTNKAESSDVLYQPAYHGTGRNFDKFDTAHINEGERSQTFGWGLYFTSEEYIARNYAERQALLKDSTRNLYKVEIPDSGYLDLDHTVGEDTVRLVAKTYAEMQAEEMGKTDDLALIQKVSDRLYRRIEYLKDFTGMDLLHDMYAVWHLNPKETSELLSRAGFVGNVYDAGDGFGWDGTSDIKNYVIYGNDDVAITEHLLWQTTSELMDDARSYDSWQKFMEAYENDGSGKLTQVPSDATAAWYQTTWELANGYTKTTEQRLQELREDQDRRDRESGTDPDVMDAMFTTMLAGNPDRLQSFVEKIAEAKNEKLNYEPQSEEEVEENNRIIAMKDKLSNLRNMSIVLSGQKLMNGEEVTDKKWKSILTSIRNAPRRYRAIYAELMDDGYWAVSEEELGPSDEQVQGEIKKYGLAEIEGADDVAKATYKQRQVIQEKIQNEKLREEVRSGKLKLSTDLDGLYRHLEGIIAGDQGKIEEIKQKEQELLTSIRDAQQRELLKKYDELLSERVLWKNKSGTVAAHAAKGVKIGEEYRSGIWRNAPGSLSTFYRQMKDLEKITQITSEVKEALKLKEQKAEIQIAVKEKKEELAAVSDLKELRKKLVKRAMRRVDFKKVEYNYAKSLIAVQRVFEPNLEGGVNRWIGTEGAWPRQVWSDYRTSEEARKKIRRQLSDNRYASPLIQLLDQTETEEQFNKWTAKDRQRVYKYLNKNNWIRELGLDKLDKEREEAIQLDIEYRENTRTWTDKDGKVHRETQWVPIMSQDVDTMVRDVLGADLYAQVVNKPFAEWTTEEMENFTKAIDDYYAEGRDALAARRQAEKEQAAELRDRIISAVKNTGIVIDENDDDETKRKKQAKIDKILGRNKEIKGTGASKYEKQNFFQLLTRGYGDMNVRRFARMLDDYSEGTNTNLLYWNENEAYKAQEKAKERRQKKIEKAMKDNGITLEGLEQKVLIPNFDEGRDITLSYDELLFYMLAADDRQSRDAVVYGCMVDEKDRQQYKDLDRAWEEGRKKKQEELEKAISRGDKKAEEELRKEELMPTDEEGHIIPPGTEGYMSRCEALYDKILSRAKALPSEYLSFAAAIQQDYDEEFDRLQQVSIDEFNSPVWRVSHYIPLVRLNAIGDTNEQKVKQDVLAQTSGAGMNKGVDKGMTAKRIRINPLYQAPVEAGLYATWTRQVDRTEHFIAYAPYARLLNRVYANRDSKGMQQWIESRYGHGAVKYIQDYINEVANPDASTQSDSVSRLVRALRGKTAPAYLSWKLSSIFKQAVTSPAPFMQYVSPMKYAAACIEMLHHPQLLSEEIKAKSVFMRDRRFDPMSDLIDEEVKKANQSKLATAWAQFQQTGMKGLEWIDWVCVAPGWYAMYKEQKDKLYTQRKTAYEARLAELQEENDHLDYLQARSDLQLQLQAEEETKFDPDLIESEAVDYADDRTRLCQPSDRKVDLSPIFKNGSETTKALLQFTTSLNVIWQNVRYDTVYAVKNSQAQQVFLMIGAYTLAGIALGALAGDVPAPGDDDDEKELKARQLIHDATTQFTDSVPVIGSMVTNLTEKAITGQSTFNSTGTDLFPTLTKVIQGTTSLTSGQWDKAAEKYGEAVGMFLGAPVSGTKELLYSVGIGDGDGEVGLNPGAFLGRRGR